MLHGTICQKKIAICVCLPTNSLGRQLAEVGQPQRHLLQHQQVAAEKKPPLRQLVQGTRYQGTPQATWGRFWHDFIEGN